MDSLRRRRALQLLLVWLWLAQSLLSPAPAASVGTVEIDPRVLEDSRDGRTAAFLVVLRDQVKATAVTAGAPAPEAGGRLTGALTARAAATQTGIRATLAAAGEPYRPFWIVNVIAAIGGRALVDRLAARPDVIAIESDRPFFGLLGETELGAPAAPSGVEWNITKVRADVVWGNGFTGQGRVYANADTGVKWDHPALINHYRGGNNPATVNHDYNWFDGVGATGASNCGPLWRDAPCDDYGHGTHVMGTAVGDDGLGNQIGLAPGAQWIACRNMDHGIGRPSSYIACLQFFMAPTDRLGNNPDPNKRPDAVGNSYTCPPSESCAAHSLQAAIENLRAAGVFIAAAAGNAGPGCGSVNEPPGLEAALDAVGATAMDDSLAGFSSRGPVTVDGSNRRKPDLAAPGVGVRSSYGFGGYSTMSGTSMATPHVAAAAVLLWSAFPALARNINATEALLYAGAVPLTSSQGCSGEPAGQVPNNEFGWGRLDVARAYDLAALPRGFLAPVVIR